MTSTNFGLRALSKQATFPESEDSSGFTKARNVQGVWKSSMIYTTRSEQLLVAATANGVIIGSSLKEMATA